MIKNIDPKLRIPSRQQLDRRFAKSKKEIIKEYKKILSKQETLHLTFDLWSSISRNSVLGLKAHFIDQNWLKQTRTIGFKHFNHRKTAHNLRLLLKTLFSKELNIKPDQISTIMADNAAENIKAFDLEEFKKDTFAYFDDEIPVTDAEESEADDPESEDTEAVAVDDLLDDFEVEDVNANDEVLLEEEIFSKVDWNNADFARLGCVAHALQLVIKEALNSHQTAKELVKIINDMVNFFHKSNTWSTRLIKKTKLSVVALGKTRWNTVYLALQRMLKENFINHVNEIYMEASDKGIKTPDLISTETGQLLSTLHEILEPIHELTNTLQGDDITSSMVLLGMICLNNALIKLDVSGDLKSLRNNICVLLVERFAAQTQLSYKGRGPRKQLLQVFQKKQYILASLLDPRVKTLPFETEIISTFGMDKHTGKKEDAVSMLIDELSLTTEPDQNPSQNSSSSNNAEAEPNAEITIEPVPKKKRSIFDDVFDNQSPDSPKIDKPACEEVEEYLKEPVLKKELCALSWWRKHHKKFPKLSKLARIYLSMPASSGGVERLFLIAGSIARARRARITMSKLEQLLLFREWRMMKFMVESSE